MSKSIKQILIDLNGHRINICTYIKSSLFPYKYDSSRYKDSFITNDARVEDDSKLAETIDRKIYIFWTGDNEITSNRLAGIKSLEKVAEVQVVLVTPKNLNQYIVPEDPLPEAYQYLSLNHKSDYLRSYFMHHHGGGYADIKTFYHSWKKAFDQLENSDAYACGYPEVGYWGPAKQECEALYTDLRTHWRYLVGNGAFICRPHTKLTEEWHNEAKRRLLVNSDALREHPAKDFFGSNGDYPLPWASMQGAIFHPLCLKYKERLMKNIDLTPSFHNYR